MRQLVFLEPGKLQWREVPSPMLEGPDEAMVRPIMVGRCDLDAMYVSGRMPLAGGEPLGHEIIAEIVDLGSNVRRFSIGQRVIVSAQISCGRCPRCALGQTARCESVPFGASYGMGRAGNYGGGLSDLLRVPFAAAMLVPLPKGSDPNQMIGLADMATDAWRAVGPALSKRPGACVLVLGGAAPVIGIYAAGMAVALGAGSVHYIDIDIERRRRATDYGAHTFENMDSCEGAPFEIIVDAGGSASQLLAALHRASPEAIVTAVCPALAGPAFPMLELYMKGLTFKIGRPNCRAGHQGALQAWSHCGFDPSAVRPKVFSFEDAAAAWCDASLYTAASRCAPSPYPAVSHPDQLFGLGG